MSDELGAAPPPADPPPSAPPPAPDPGAAPPPEAKGAPPEADPKPPEGDPPVEPTWPERWREEMAGDDAEYLRWLKRFNSPANVGKSAWNGHQKLTSGKLMAQLGDDATPEEVAAYRKQAGIPETPEGYDFKAPEGLQITDADKAVIDAMKPAFHELNIPPKQAEALVNRVLAMNADTVQHLYESARDKTTTQRAEIMAELGNEFKPALRVAESWMDQTIGPERRGALVELTLADGTKLGDHPDFVRLWVNAGKVASGDGLLLDGRGAIEADPKGKLNNLFADYQAGKMSAAAYEQEARKLADQINALERRSGK